ncbi:MAG: U32 family peptidase [Eubacterium sp.]|nr:U32 family peptidase [Eubacterium sp.]
MNKPEILAPAGSLEVLKTAINYGADAVYIGGEQFGLRAKAENFSEKDMKSGIDYAHEKGKKVYVTANITAHERDITGVRDYFEWIAAAKPDALIISDPGVFMIAKDVCPNIDVHISTQANNVNSLTCKFWKEQGATRVVTARELSLAEIASIKKEVGEELELETFVHGAMCISYSGRCLLSHYFTGRDANLGACTHPCRWRYHIVEETRPGEYLPVEENERGTYIFNSKDLCMVDHIPELVEAGIDSFKIEGRMKTALYVATVTRAYRMAVDDYFSGKDVYKENLNRYLEEVTKCTYRQHTTGFFFGSTNEKSQIYDNNTYSVGATYLGCIEEKKEKGAVIEQKNKFSVGDTVEIMKPSGDDKNAKVVGMYDEFGNSVDSCPHPKQKITLDLDEDADVGDIIRKV